MPITTWFSSSNKTKMETNSSTKAPPLTLPDFVLRYAPLLYLHKKELYFPGDPIAHISHTSPQLLDGTDVVVPEEHQGKVSMLALPEVNRPDVFLTLKKQPRSDPTMPELTSLDGKPNAENKSVTSPTFIIHFDKSSIEGGDVVTIDAFYFFFYPFNLGNKVLFKNWGNHVGDWEHVMIRFKDGVPQYIHLSAHSDGNAWPWAVIQKNLDRPIIYSAGGSHAHYPKVGTHAYSGVPLFGPKDYTSAGYLLDPTLNFVCAECHPGITFTYTTSPNPGHNKSISSTDLITMLSFTGRWGNSFSNLRQECVFPFFVKKKGKNITKVENKVDDKLAKPADHIIQQAEADVVQGAGPVILATTDESKLTLYQKLLVLIWAEGPTGPRDKSLDRKNMNRWESREPLTSL